MTTKTLVVRNLEQAAAWLELDGQISDGMWENAKPLDHWKPWCDAVVRVAAPGEQVGRDFHVSKSNYNFTSKALLDVVGLRMLGTVRIARRFGLEVASMLEFATDTDGTIDPTRDYSKAAALAGLAPTPFVVELQAAVADQSYTMKHLRADLKDLKLIVRMWLPVR